MSLCTIGLIRSLNVAIWEKGPQREIPRDFRSSVLLWHSAIATGHSGNKLLHCTDAHVDAAGSSEPKGKESLSSDIDSDTEEDRKVWPSYREKINEAEVRLIQKGSREVYKA